MCVCVCVCVCACMRACVSMNEHYQVSTAKAASILVYWFQDKFNMERVPFVPKIV